MSCAVVVGVGGLRDAAPNPLYALLRRIGAGGRRVAVMALNFARLRTRSVGADLESDCGAEEVCGLTGRV